MSPKKVTPDAAPNRRLGLAIAAMAAALAIEAAALAWCG